MTQSSAKVAIVGGGLAGIYTAYLLQQSGISFQLFEAKPFLGGRIYGEATESERYKIDLGPSWIFPHQNKIQQLAKLLGLELVEQFSQGDAVFQRHPHETPQHISGVAPPMMLRVAGGTTKLIDTLAVDLLESSISLGSVVFKLEFNGERWKVFVSSEQSTERSVSSDFEHLVIAIPPRLVVDKLSLSNEYAKQISQASNNCNAFVRNQTTDTSELNNEAKTKAYFFKNLLAKFASTPTWMAAQSKFAVTYKTPFWRERGLCGQAFSHVGPMVEIHDASHEDKYGKSVYALFGFIGVPYSHRQRISNEEMTQACLSQLCVLFGKELSEYQYIYLKDWARDPFTASAQDQTQASTHPHIELKSEQVALAQMHLHLATSEFAQTEAGYMEGAVIAAENTVNQIKKSI